MSAAGREIQRPNRETPQARAMRAAVAVALLASAAVMALITLGGWGALSGERPLQIALALVYVVLARYVWGWRRGVLPLAGALAVILAITAAVAAPGWFDRDRFSTPQSVFGGGVDADLLGLLTLLLIPLQALLVALAARAFGQEWHVEIVASADPAGSRPLR